MLLQSLIDVLLCFGPLLLMVIAIFWLFSRLDARWKAEAQSAQGQSTLIKSGSQTRCWQLIDCPPEQREDCPGYQNQDIPCWQHFRSADEQLNERCLDCEVFIKTPVPA